MGLDNFVNKYFCKKFEAVLMFDLEVVAGCLRLKVRARARPSWTQDPAPDSG